MKSKKQSGQTEITPGDIWNDEKLNALKSLILSESGKQSPARKLRNELLAIQYQMEDYIQSEEIGKEMRLADFVKLYLKALGITQKQLAAAFGIQDPNLHKYLTGERKLNPDLALKLSFFFHTRPEVWYHIQTKNELLRLRREQDNLSRYRQYDYENFISVAAEPRAPYGLTDDPDDPE